MLPDGVRIGYRLIVPAADISPESYAETAKKFGVRGESRQPVSAVADSQLRGEFNGETAVYLLGELTGHVAAKIKSSKTADKRAELVAANGSAK